MPWKMPFKNNFFVVVVFGYAGSLLNSDHLHWEHRVPTTGPPGKSQTLIF